MAVLKERKGALVASLLEAERGGALKLTECGCGGFVWEGVDLGDGGRTSVLHRGGADERGCEGSKHPNAQPIEAQICWYRSWL